MSRTITLHLVGCLFFILFFTTSVKAQNEAKQAQFENLGD